jgi:hypothetical protein
MAPDDRSERFTMRVRPEEKQMIAALAERDGQSASDYLRLLVRRTYEASFGGEKSKKKPASGTHEVTRKRVQLVERIERGGKNA